MPPVRTAMSTKGLKTERTHEENQERAYIAASRRSDRSLEARIESARRASEIHKKRTGRALRVTEQDVINEEMYEEEDDDLHSQYRRLQAHLGSTADVFNGRLSAWVMSAYGTRQMALAASQNGMMFNPNMQPPATPFFAYQPQAQSPTGAISPGMTQRNQSYRQSPYPQQHPRMQDGRSQSVSSLPEHQGQPGMIGNSSEAQTFQHQRRQSMASQVDGHSVPGTPQPQGDMGRPPMSRNGSGMQPGHLGHPAFFAPHSGFESVLSPQSQYGGFPTGVSSYDPMMGPMQDSISPLTTSLPVEAQQMIGTSFDSQGQYTQMFMNMSHGQPVPPGINYTYRPNLGSSNVKTSAEGINQTLSPNPMVSGPAKIDTNVDHLNTPAMTSGSTTSPDAFPSSFVPNMNFDGSVGLGMSFDNTPGGSKSAGTPDDFFSNWVDAPSAEEAA